ncbi:MAG: hypothetical protein IKZ95_00265 [Lachnospiraceae bacterium]|nr:hypothetical protein [Lachnospiraceae bacterium]
MAAIDGKWNIAVHTPFGDMKSVLDVKEVDGKLEGTVTDGMSGEVSPVENGTINGAEFSYEIAVKSPFGEMRNTLVGTIEGDALKGKAKNPMGDSDFDAARA